MSANHSRLIVGSFRFYYGVNFVFFALLLSLVVPYVSGQISNVPTPPPPPPVEVVYPSEPKIKVSPPLAIILACLVSTFFIMGCISVYVRQCFERRMALSFTIADDGVDSSRFFRRAAAARGLDPSIIDSFPTFVYSEVKGLKIGEGALECAVCLNEFEDDQTLRVLPKCSHVFHPDCIDAWLASHVTCPVCRATLVPKPGETGLFSSYLPSHDSDGDRVDSPNLREIQDFGDPRLSRVVDDLPISVQSSPDVINHSQTPNRDCPPNSTPKRVKTTGKFPRSHSTGHLLVQAGENCERFTLRLPEEVRNRLLNTSLSRTRSCMAFPRARSSRKGYRSCSGGTDRGKDYYYERFDIDVRSDRWVFTMTPPFVSRSGSTRSQKMAVGDEMTTTPKSLLKSVKSPFDRFFGGRDKDNIGERSIDRLRLDDQV